MLYGYIIALVMDATIALNQTHLMYMTEAERTKRRKATQKRTAFDDPHGQIPAITLRAYLDRIVKYTKATREALVLTVLQLDLYTKHSGRPLAPSMAHRIFMAAFVANSKFNDELWHTNNYYSRVAGVNVEEMNLMEIEFLASCSFGLMIPRKEFDPYSKVIYTLARRAAQLGGVGSLDRLAHAAVLSAPTRPTAILPAPAHQCLAPATINYPMTMEPAPSAIPHPTPVAPF